MAEQVPWQEELRALQQRWVVAAQQADTLDALRGVEVDALGKKGEVTALLKRVGTLPPIFLSACLYPCSSK